MRLPKRCLGFLLNILLVASIFSILFMNVWQIKPVQATTLFTDGEVGSTLETAHDLSAWSSSSQAAASTTVARSGSYSIKFDGDDHYAYYTPSPELEEFYMNFSWYLSIWDSSANDISRVVSDIYSGISLRITNSSTNHVWQLWIKDNGESEYLYNSTETISLGTWYTVGIWWQKNTLNGARLDIDGTTVLTADVTLTNNNVSSLRFSTSRIAGTAVPTWYVDDISIYDVDQELSPPSGSVDGLPKADQYVIQNLTSGYSQIRGSDNTTLMTNGNFSYLAQQALNNLTSGQTVCFNGTITQNTRLTIPISNLRLDWWKSNVTVTATNQAMYIVGKTNITIINGALYGLNNTGITQYAILDYSGDSLSVYNMSINLFSYLQGAIQVDDCSNCIIQNNSFNIYDNYAVVFNNMNDSLIANNTIEANSCGSAIGVFGTDVAPYLYTVNKNVTIANNTINNVGIGIRGWHAIYVAATNATDIYGNTITVVTNSPCMSIKSPNTLFHNNTMTVASGHGFQIWEETGPSESVNGTKIYNNTLTGGDDAYSACFYEVGGNAFSDVLFENNTISHWKRVLSLNSATAANLIENITFRWNTVSDCGDAYGPLYIGGDNPDGTQTFVHNVKIMNNTFTTIPSPTIHVQNGTLQVEIAYNVLSACTAPAMDNKTESIWIHDNTGLTDYFGSTYYYGVGITISSPTNTTYPSSTIPVTFSASGGTIDQKWWNCKNETSWIYPTNQTYTGSTSMTGFVNGTSYTFYAFANNTFGDEGYSAIMFSVGIYVVPPTDLSYVAVSLNSPTDGYTTTSTVITFTYTPYTTSTFENASLYLNVSGTWQSAGLNTTAILNNTVNSWTYMFLTYGTFSWNIQVYNTTDYAFANANFTLTLTAPTVTPSTGNVFYFCPDTQTINTVTGYKLSETQPNSNASASISASGNVTGYVAYRVFIVYDDGTMFEISSGYIAITGRTNDTEGLINATWTCPRTSLNVGFQALRVEMYMQIGSGGWIDKATFISGFLNETEITNSTWVFQTYTKHAYTGGSTIMTATWGTNIANSLIDNVGVTDPSIYDLLIYQLNVGNFVGFIFMPYTNLVGNLFYGLLLLVFFVPLYNRYKSFSPIIILLILFGGAGGILSLMVPEAGLGISWIFLVVGIGGLIYKVFR